MRGHRQTIKSPIIHSDFEMFWYNNTHQARKYFDYEWDFAVHCQGHNDYTKRYLKTDELTFKKHFMFFKCNSKVVRDKLMSIDYEQLTHLNVTTPGFSKQDVLIALYGVQK